YPGWQLMKAQAVADRQGLSRLVAHQVYYSLIGRAYEAELMPLAVDQGVGALVWSPLGWGRLTGRIGRGRPIPAGSRLQETEQFAPPVEEEHLYQVIDALEDIARETGKSVPQIAINWLLQRPTVSSVIIGARNEEQLRQNLGAVGWKLTPEQMAALDSASDLLPPYPHTPYRQQEGFARLNPAIV
ncbi:MAG: aldo/keto reductase, partial [Devosia sp.]|uniref:aldo/keto reductase n=1 Tax=Devosia sp. TaxID=1871048 RepID=UPI003396A625